ncbi:Holliday junction branch migration protein RuvA [soil metagenome]
MIGRLKGTLAEVEGNIGMIETSGGVYYQVYLTSTLLTRCIPPSAIDIYTFLNVREDALTLFGFESKKEYRLFTLLLGVPGVGPKSAFGIISYAKPNEFINAIKTNDSAYFTKIPGLGKKTALKIILELSAKFESEFVFEPTIVSEEDVLVIEALVSLGFRSNDAKEMLNKLDKNKSTEEKISEGIRMLSRKQ